MTLRELGWTWPQWHTFRSREGFELCLDQVGPADVKAMVLLDSDAQMWASWTAREEFRSLAPRPLIEPIAQLMSGRASGTWTAAHRVVTGSTVQGGMWTQERLWEAGRADVADCQLCGARGTTHHRLYCCPCFAEARRGAPPQMQHRGEQADPGNLMWLRGLAKDPSTEWAFQPVQEQVRAVTPVPGEVLFTGDGFTDGSLRGGHRTGGQAGWAAVTCPPGETRSVTALYGPLPVALPVQRRILRAELWGLLQILVACMPPLRVHVDNATVVRGVAMGRAWCCHSSRPHADVWRRIWHYLDDIGLGTSGIVVQKCKSHQSESVIATLSAAEQAVARGNQTADEHAKLGADMTFPKRTEVRQCRPRRTASSRCSRTSPTSLSEQGARMGGRMSRLSPSRRSR